MATAHYVIVGAGSAGCVLADRLSADGRTSVVLVEAGRGEPDSIPEVQVPILFPRTVATEIDWGYRTVPQPGLAGRVVPYPRGKTLGGSSAINAQLWTIGHRADYDGWAADGCEGWGYADVLPYFEKAATDRLHLAGIRYPSPVTPDFLTACAQVGYVPAIEAQDGYSLARANHKDGLRWSSADGYLGAARDRDNLTVITDALVRRVVFSDLRAAGVEVEGADGVRELWAQREVILAAGAVGSPHILMLSGVGPAAHLAEHGIPVLVDAPEVGANLADHLHVPLPFAARGFRSPGAEATPAEIARYLKNREGPLGSIFAEALLFLRTHEKLIAPDIEILLLLGPYGTDAAHGVSLGVVLLRPQSKGSIRLHSADPRDAPLIDPAYLTDSSGDDLATTVAGIRKAQQLADQTVLAKWLGQPLISGALRNDTDGIVEYIRWTGTGIHHPVSTCRMGPDRRAVVDLRFRVRGISALRVVDASAMPSLVRAHTHAPVTMLAERASELIVDGS